jgi:uncharacterized tellurite resistance protein B-like protein
VFLIIWGFRVLFKTINEGEFHCPNCGGDRHYWLKDAKRWFTLFFIPVIPLNHVAQVVECATCRRRFNPTVLQAPTTAQLASGLVVGMRAAAATVVQAGPGDDSARRQAVEAVRTYGLAGYDAAALAADLGQPVEAADHLIETAGAQLTPEAREWFFAQLVRIALADGTIDDNERQTLHRVAVMLGMTPAHAYGVIATTERTRPQSP